MVLYQPEKTITRYRTPIDSLAAKGHAYTGFFMLAIEGLDGLDTDSTKVFHAGTANKDNNIVTNGDRVLCACALGNTVTEAQTEAYESIQGIITNLRPVQLYDFL